MPTARWVSAKAHAFDADGDETTTDFERMLRIVAGAGYTGPLEVEYEGDGMSEDDGIRATIQLIRRVSPAD
jgi:sugar phosphate isomerase/epimerase